MAVQLDDGVPLMTEIQNCMPGSYIFFAAVVSWVELPYSSLSSGNKNVMRAFVSE